jgi:hypothetical protein
MPLSQTNQTYIDASGSTFNDVQGDQIFHFNTLFYCLDPDQIRDQLSKQPPCSTGDTLRSPITNAKDLMQRRSRAIAYLRRVSGYPDDILCLVKKIKSMIGDLPSSPSPSSALELELEILYQTLQITAAGIKAYEYTEIGKSLAKLINPYLVQCVRLLQELCQEIEFYKRSLWPTSIWFLWPLAWWYGCEEEKLSALREGLSTCRKSLGMFVKALNL